LPLTDLQGRRPGERPPGDQLPNKWRTVDEWKRSGT
jgi:hypothetical protein